VPGTVFGKEIDAGEVIEEPLKESRGLQGGYPCLALAAPTGDFSRRALLAFAWLEREGLVSRGWHEEGEREGGG
jgi:hypothetical protein